LIWTNKQDFPELISALCHILEALALKVTKWQVEIGDTHEWADLSSERQLEIRLAKEKGETVVHFRARSFPYEINLVEMKQTNLKTGTLRPIRELEVSMSAVADSGEVTSDTVPEVRPYKWQVSNGRDGWWDFPADVDAKLKEAKAAGLVTLQATVRSQTYDIDLHDMFQQNKSTGTKRQIRICEL